MGGVATMPSSTYPNHATFVTGTDPSQHGIYANRVVVEGQVRAAADVRRRGETVFDTCRRSGHSTAAVLGDHHLVAVMGADTAEVHWPPAGRLPAATPLDELGYATDIGVLGPLREAVERSPDLLVAHLNGPDTAGHVFGPDSVEAAERYRATDAVLGQVLAAMAPRWHEWTVIVVSDHDQETVTVDEPVDVAAAARRTSSDVTVVPEGGAALVAGPDPTGGVWLDAVGGVAGHHLLAPDLRLVWTSPGRYVGSAPSPIRGVHGGLRQFAQVAVVGGGHSASARLAASIRLRRPPAASWAGTITQLLGRHADLPAG
jgi:hypothetical protein